MSTPYVYCFIVGHKIVHSFESAESLRRRVRLSIYTVESDRNRVEELISTRCSFITLECGDLVFKQ